MMLEDGRRARRLAEQQSKSKWGRKSTAETSLSGDTGATPEAGAAPADPLAHILGLGEAAETTPPSAGAAETPADDTAVLDEVSTDLVRADARPDDTLALPIQPEADAVTGSTIALLTEPAAPAPALATRPEPGASPKPKPKQRVSVVGILGEVFITAGVLVLAFLGWQVWLNDIIVGQEQQQEAIELSESWDRGESTAPAPVDRPDPGEPLVAEAPGNAVKFATLIVPRFGPEWEKPVAEGVGIHDVLNNGIGHYPGTQMPGEVGNTAYAAHRTGWGAPFGDIGNLQVGDSIYIETEAGWYRYVFRSFEYVMPTGVEVLEPVPQAPGATPTDRIITLTSCNPKTTAAERIIAYGVYDTWYPRAGGPPAEIAPVVQAAG